MEHEPVCQQQEALVAYLYDESEPAERAAFEAHLEMCARCVTELESLRRVRGTLETWVPPELNLGVRIVADRPVVPGGWWRRAFQPSWGLAAAAAVVLLVAAAVASVEIRFGDDGFVFRMGWAGRATESAAAPAAVETPVIAPIDDAMRPVSRAQLAALGDELRRELRAGREAAGPATGSIPVVPASGTELAVRGQPGRTLPAGVQWNDAEMFQRFQALVTQSEQRQRQELALWLTELTREYDMQRLADQRRVHQQLGAIEDGFNEFLVRTSER